MSNPCDNSSPDDVPAEKRWSGIARHMLLRLGGISVAVLAFTVLVVHHLTSEEIREEVVAHAMSEVRGEVRTLDGIVASASLIPRFIAARQLVIGPARHVAWTMLFRELLSTMPADELYGVYIAYAEMASDAPGSSPWMDRKSFPSLGTWKYDFHEAPWYRGALTGRGIHITDPYFDAGGSEITMVSVSQPIWIDDKLFAIAGADLSLERIRQMVSAIRLVIDDSRRGENFQHAMLASSSGAFIAHPDPLFLADSGRSAKSLADLPYGDRIAASPEGNLRIDANGFPRLVFWATAPVSGWKLILDVPENLITAPADDVTAKTFVAALTGLALLLVLAGADARRIAKPLRTLANVAARFQKGRFDTPIPDEFISRRDEIAALALALRGMAEKIRSSREKELAEWNLALEETVRNRTAELARAVEEAKAANRAKSAFLANMSHELRTPLNAIIGYSEMLAEDAADSGHTSAFRDLDKIHKAGRHLLDLINDILDLSKIEADKMTVFLEIIDLEALVSEVRNTVSPLAEKNANRFRVEASPPLGQLHSDSTKIRQILFNLLGNSFKFTSQGEVVLLVERFSSAGAEWVRFAVRDTGIGMSSNQLVHIFDAFTQADDSTTRPYGGTGLGLAICQRFSRMLGGDIRVKSEPGRGSTFTVEIPCQAPAPRAEK